MERDLSSFCSVMALAFWRQHFRFATQDARADTDGCSLKAIYVWDLFKLNPAARPRNVYKKQNGFTTNATSEPFPVGFFDPSDPDYPNDAPDPEVNEYF